MVLNGGAWLEGVHRRYIEPFQDTSNTASQGCDMTYTIKGNTPFNLLDIRYPDSDDFLTFTFKTPVSEVKLNSLTTGKSYTSTSSTDKLTHEIYGPEPGEYEMFINYVCKPSGVDEKTRVKLNPVFNFAGREDTYYKLPITGWSPSANMEIQVSGVDKQPSSQDSLTLNMQQFNMVQIKTKLPNLTDYINKLTQLGFGSKDAKDTYKGRIARLESYIPVKIEGTLELIGLKDGSPVPKTNFPAPRLIFPSTTALAGEANSCVSADNCKVTIRNVRNDHMYKLTMYVKYQRPDSLGYRTTQVKSLDILVEDPTGDNDLTGAGSTLIDYTDVIARNAELQLKFEREQAIQDVKLGVLEDAQNQVFDKVSSL
jgi:hypothetical protein